MALFEQRSIDAVTSVPIRQTNSPFSKATIQPDGANIRVRWDGQAATTALGILVFSSGSIVIEGLAAVGVAQMIAVSGTPTVNIMLE
jgi:hypothetical protein